MFNPRRTVQVVVMIFSKVTSSIEFRMFQCLKSFHPKIKLNR